MLTVTARGQREAPCPRRSTQAPAQTSCASCGSSREGQGLQLRLKSPACHQAIKLAVGKLTEEVCARARPAWGTPLRARSGKIRKPRPRNKVPLRSSPHNRVTIQQEKVSFANGITQPNHSTN